MHQNKFLYYVYLDYLLYISIENHVKSEMLVKVLFELDGILKHSAQI